jgi:type II secretory pathway pseudopilin PulG
VVLVVLGAGLVGVAVLGILAAIAIPNFLRYQLRAKASEVPAQLQALDQAELARRALGESYLVFADGLPAGQDAGQAKLAWAEDDLAVVSELAWKPGPATWARYAVDGLEDDEGNQAIALCGETDLDGDGVLAAWAVFRPALAKDGSMVVPPPPAPCSAKAALREGASLEFDPAVPPGRVVRLSPDDVF